MAAARNVALPPHRPADAFTMPSAQRARNIIFVRHRRRAAKEWPLP